MQCFAQMGSLFVDLRALVTFRKRFGFLGSGKRLEIVVAPNEARCSDAIVDKVLTRGPIQAAKNAPGTGLLARWVAPVGSFEPTGVAKPEEVELSRATFPATSCAVGTQVAEAATCATRRLLQRLVRRYLAANSGRAYDSRNPQAEQRKTPTGTHLSGKTILTCRNSQPTFAGAPSTQVLTIRLGPSLPQVKPCTISPLHLGHRFVPALMLEPPN